MSLSELTSLGMWIVSSDNRDRPFTRRDEIFPYIEQLTRDQSVGRIVAIEDVGARSWVERVLFRMHPRSLQMHFAVTWSGSIASLMFFDDVQSEFRARDKEQPVHPDEETRIALGDEFSPHPAEESIALERALLAITEYLNKGSRPMWLDYKYVR